MAHTRDFSRVRLHLGDIEDNLQFVDSSNESVKLGEILKDSESGLCTFDILEKTDIFPSLIGYIVKISATKNVIIAVEELNDILLEVADLVVFCERYNENWEVKCERLKKFEE